MTASPFLLTRRRCLRRLGPTLGGVCLGAATLAGLPCLALTSEKIRATGPDALEPPRPDRGEATPKVLRFTFSRRREDPRTQWLIAVYRELLASLGIGFEFVDVPPGRGPIAVRTGDADGELGRTWGYGLLNPELVRVAESNNAVEFAACATEASLGDRFPGWPAVREQRWRCEHRRGIPELADLLAREVPPEQVSTVATIEQGLRRLQLKRIDLYLDVREAVEDHLAFGDVSAEFSAGPAPRMLGVIQSTTGHAYLHRRHEALVPAITQALREMKRQGTVARLREEALKRFLATRAK